MRPFYKTLFCFTLLFSPTLMAQELVGSAGGAGSSASATLSWSVGEPMTETYATGGANRLSQGLLQPELSIVTSMDELGEAWGLSIYPNPTSSTLLINVPSPLEQAHFLLTDINGKVLQQGTIEKKETWIECSQLPASNYFLQISTQDKKHKTFKITKL